MEAQWFWAAGAVRLLQPCLLSRVRGGVRHGVGLGRWCGSVAGATWLWVGVWGWVFVLAAHGAGEVVEVL